MHRVIPESPTIQETAASIRQRLMDEFRGDHWEGELSHSALAAAVAVFALHKTDRKKHREAVQRGLSWLAHHANPDGGWGDSPKSRSNLSTTLLCWSAFSADAQNDSYVKTIEEAERWIIRRAGSLHPEAIARAVLAYYKSDRTFSAPILTLCALAGRLGTGPECWTHVPQLPMELAVLPHGFFKRLRLPVVSYALPALIAVGLVRHVRAPSSCALKRTIRNRWTRRLLRNLQTMQPGNGGFLEATPLTSFVVMSLVSAGHQDHPVVRQGIRFILASQSKHGGWPIDTNLATWITTLAVKALAGNNGLDELSAGERNRIKTWLLDQQFQQEHPFTHSPPGGWSWTDLPGGVPDADDTSGALLALKLLGPVDAGTKRAAADGIRWLLELQNRDGGIPTFCRGWARLPFDRSCADITSHALRAFAAWRDSYDAPFRRRIDRGIRGCLRFLRNSQREDGSWLPLWFGNEEADNQENPLYGTAQVFTALKEDVRRDRRNVERMLEKAAGWIKAHQNGDGGWGSRKGMPSTIEETALALSALSDFKEGQRIHRGISWLRERIEKKQPLDASPIGLYFAGLWYYEELYSLIFSVQALGMYRETINNRPVEESVASEAIIL